MTTTDWVQAISAGITALATLTLAVMTYIYARRTSQIANLTKIQTDLLSEADARKYIPFFEATFVMGGGDGKVIRNLFSIQNSGETEFILIGVKTAIWHEDDPTSELQIDSSERNICLSPKRSYYNLEVKIVLNPSVGRFFPDKEKKIKYQSTFIIRDAKNREHNRPFGIRSLF